MGRRLGAMLVLALAAALAVTAFSPAATPATSTGAGCASAPYSYAGVHSVQRVSGIAAQITPLTTVDVEDGHVGAWVGVGAPGAGPHGEDEWIQVGFSAFPGAASAIYYEVARPGEAPRYQSIASDPAVGQSHRLAVLEVAGRPGHWRVWIDQRPVTAPIYLPGSHRAWQGVATTESWSPRRVCNDFRFRFDGLRVSKAPGGSWTTPALRPFTDRGYRLTARTTAAFVAAGPAATLELRAKVASPAGEQSGAPAASGPQPQAR